MSYTTSKKEEEEMEMAKEKGERAKNDGWYTDRRTDGPITE